MSEQANTPKTGPGELARQLDEPSLEPAEPAAWYRSARLNGQEANRNVSRALDQGPDCESDEDGQTSTVSISSSVLQYRAINGRTYHSARHATDYFTPNDQQHQESLDLTHHYLTILLNGKLFLAPIPNDVKAVVDIGTGTGIWAIDFADMYPDAQVTGTDLSPMQPSWAPCNLKFEIDDATLPWTWAPDSFDFVHMRYLLGAINDWTALFMQAYRCCKPGGWVQSAEVDPTFHSDHGTVDAHPVLAKWNEMFREASRRTGRSFVVASEDVQHKGILAAGFTDLSVVNFKLPLGGWARDPRLKDAGRFAKAALERDLEGYTYLLWHEVLEWPQDQHSTFIRDMRSVLRSRQLCGYLRLRYVYGRKPLKT